MALTTYFAVNAADALMLPYDDVLLDDGMPAVYLGAAGPNAVRIRVKRTRWTGAVTASRVGLTVVEGVIA